MRKGAGDLDPAIARRVLYRIDFRVLDEAQREAYWQALLPAERWTSQPLVGVRSRSIVIQLLLRFLRRFVGGLWPNDIIARDALCSHLELRAAVEDLEHQQPAFAGSGQ